MKFLAKKSLGQNFLIDKNIIEKIVNLENIKNEFILEIGPGTGSLTKQIMKHDPKHLILIEKDEMLAKYLEENLLDKVKIINKDILEIDEYNLSKNKLLVFGNLPYNISTEILIKWISNIKKDFWFKKLILMFQKEVADRIVSDFNKKTYGRLSILAQWKLNIEKKFDVKPFSFYPKPKVDSSVLIFTPKNDYKNICSDESLKKITRIFFNERRKKIKKPLNKIFSNSEKIKNELNLNLDLRPQNLHYLIFLKLARYLDKLGN